MMYTIKIYLLLVKIRLKSQMSYRKSFFIEIIGNLLQMGTHIAGIFFIFHHTRELNNWTVWEILYLYGLTSSAHICAQFFAEAFEDIHFSIRLGDFDQILTKPVSPLVLIAANSFRIERIGGLIQGFAALIISGIKTNYFTSFNNCSLVFIAVFSMIIVYYALYLAAGAFSFWSLEGNEAFNAFTYGGVEVAKYPLSIYEKWMQSLFIYFIPLGLASYIPAAKLFAKPLNLNIWSPGVLLVPITCSIFLFIIWNIWNFSIKHYQSTGA